MSAAQETTRHLDVAPLVVSTAENLREMIRRSPLWQRMDDGSLTFNGRAAYLEQHWEGLRALLAAADTLDAPELAELRGVLRANVERMGDALDRSHASSKWRKHHVTMPSMLEFRRRLSEIVDGRNIVALVAHATVRLAAIGACPVPAGQDSFSIPTVTVVGSDEDEELFAEELSVGMIMVMSHGADVCRAYQDQRSASSCAVTAAMIRQALRG